MLFDLAKQRMAAEVQAERDVMVSFARQPHPFVVPALRSYRSGSHYHLVMPFLAGGTLLAHIKAQAPARLEEASAPSTAGRSRSRSASCTRAGCCTST